MKEIENYVYNSFIGKGSFSKVYISYKEIIKKKIYYKEKL